MAGMAWARSRGDRGEVKGLRRGAWYRVVEEHKTKTYVVLDVHGVELRVPRRELEVRREAPKSWSVVHEPHLVCPGCHQRRHVSGKPKEVKCTECGHSYAVNWEDRA